MRSKFIAVDGEEVIVTQKYIKNMYLRVLSPSGTIAVSAPLGIPDNAVAEFVRQKKDWIAQRRQQINSRPVLKKREYVSGETLLVWGKVYPLTVQNGAINDVRFRGETVVMTILPGSGPKRRAALMLEWYRSILTAKIGEYLPKWEKITGLKCSGYQTKNMKTRWGTCNTATNKIWLSVRLAQKPPVCLEYVILHELAHTRVPNHGGDFEAILDRFMPDWKSVKKLLDECQTEYDD